MSKHSQTGTTKVILTGIPIINEKGHHAYSHVNVNISNIFHSMIKQNVKDCERSNKLSHETIFDDVREKEKERERGETDA